MIQVKARETELREQGLCPHSLRKCDRSRMCLLSVREACILLIQNTVCNCYSCKRRKPCVERFKCFRDTGKGVRI